jgi:hypothetical protein
MNLRQGRKGEYREGRQKGLSQQTAFESPGEFIFVNCFAAGCSFRNVFLVQVNFIKRAIRERIIFRKFYRRGSRIAESDYFIRHVCLSAWNNSVRTGRIFMKFDIPLFFENLSRKNQVESTPNKNNGYYT